MWGKSFITAIENEFKTDKMRNHKVIHDINLRVNDPEAFRITSIDFIRGLDYIVDVNEMTEFEEGGEFEKLFKGGRLKPFKNVIKARKTSNLGPKYPNAWKLLLTLGIAGLIAYLTPLNELNKNLLFYTFMISFILSGIIYLFRKTIISSIWVKIIGVHDIENTKSDIRVIITGDLSDDDLKIFDRMRDEISEFYELIGRKYGKEKIEPVLKATTKSKSEEVLIKLSEINNNIQTLRDKFINGKVSEEVFKNLMNSLEKDKDRLETVIDLLSL